MRLYPVKLVRDGDTFLATFPHFPGATFGASKEEATLRSQSALVTVLAGMVSKGLHIPEPPAVRDGQRSVKLPVVIEAKLDLYRQWRRLKISKAELGRRLNLKPPQVDRLLDLNHRSTLEAVEKALEKLGRSIEITFHNAKKKVA